ncbi:MAG: alpha-galactosidase [Acidimicrobiales bacterium]
MSDDVHLSGGGTSVVVDLDGPPAVRYWGPALGADPPEGLFEHALPVGDLDQLAPVALLPEASLGFPGPPGLAGSRLDGTDWTARLRLHAHRVEETSLSLALVDPVADLEATITLDLDPSGVLSLRAQVTNGGSEPYALANLSMSLPLSEHADEVLTLGGRWANEFRVDRHPWRQGCLVVENRRGRTSHDHLPFIAVGGTGFSEDAGQVWAAHLGWSGNATLRVDRTSDGRRFLQAGELLLPGEVVLEPGGAYRSPRLYAACSDTGLNGIRRSFHGFLRGRPSHPTTPRPVLLNTWEAVYFDHDLETLTALADRAAEVGVERFVLDDGWFHGRRSDSAGLGDWWVDDQVWPDGLGPLISQVRQRGMEFGLWVEPEMVNPDSDLYRAHPEWVLSDHRYEPVLGRRQLVLDLARPDVSEYLFEHLDRLLATHEVAFVKWDMNRDLVHATHEGRAGVHRQTLAVYGLIDRLRSAHPGVEIESCASGGGRADYGILKRTDRVWTSDCNDALDRVGIQYGAGILLPPELMGAHIGGPRSHTTGRTHRLDLRATVALFGHLGVEWNLLDASAEELEDLSRAIAVHKQHRALLRDGRAVVLDHGDPAVSANGVIAPDRSEGLFAVVQLASSDALPVAPLQLPGLDPDTHYRVELITLGRSPLGMAYQHPSWINEGIELTGRMLAAAGVPLPVMLPESARLIHVKALDA